MVEQKKHILFKKAVFFDRDDTLIKNVPYNGDPSKVKLAPGIVDCLKTLKNAGFVIIVITNQSGVGKGWITKEQVEAVNEEMKLQLRKEGKEDFIADIYICYADPNTSPPHHDLSRRKPSPAMLLEARDKYNIDLSQSYMVGDKVEDIECGKAAGSHTILVELFDDKKNEVSEKQSRARELADSVATHLNEVADYIIIHSKKSSSLPILDKNIELKRIPCSKPTSPKKGSS